MSGPNTCRACGCGPIQEFLSLGRTPIANALVAPELAGQPDPEYPLALAFCSACSLVQLTESLPSEAIFSEEYPYYSSYSDALLKHSREHAVGLIESRRLDGKSFVVEVASNDGYLLRNFVEAGIPVLGIDPSPGPAEAARSAGVPTLIEFFGNGEARRIRDEYRPADVIVANNVMAHVPDLNGFVAGMRALIADDGLITIENPYVRDLIDHREFDTVYHEHYCYFSCTAVDRLVRRHGLYLNDVEYFPELHGGTLRWHVGPREQVTARAQGYLEDEERAGLTRFDYYIEFGAEVARIKDELVTMVRGLRREGKSIAAYGAAAKGSTLLNFAGIGNDVLDFVVDRNPHKQGLLMPGVHVPIWPVEALSKKLPDYVLMLAWNFKDEILRQQSEYLAAGGKFIVPVPQPKVVKYIMTNTLVVDNEKLPEAETTLGRRPRLTIGLPVYNGEQFIRDVLNSMLAQTFRDWELIVSDNASTDATEAICRDYMARDSRIRYSRNRENIGLAKNHNLAFSLSDTEFFKWISHDDIYLPRYLEACIEKLDAIPAAVVAFSGARAIDGRGNTVPGFEWDNPTDYDQSDNAERFKAVVGGFDDALRKERQHPGIYFFGVIRSAALRRTRLEMSHMWADVTMISELALLGPFVRVEQTLLLSRVNIPHASSLMIQGDLRGWAALLDPANGGRFKSTASRYRRYLEYFRSVWRSELSLNDKIKLSGFCAGVAFRRARMVGIGSFVKGRRLTG